MTKQSLRAFHKTYVQGIPPKVLVVPEVFLVAILSNDVKEVLPITSSKVYIRSIALKHIYEKRSAYEYDVLLSQMETIIQRPDKIFVNTSHKLADYIFTKLHDGAIFACLLKMNAHPEVGQEITMVVTAYKTTERYLKSSS